MHYYKRNLGDYAKKAGRLSMLQHGSYTLLIDACYDREQFPTMDEAIEWTWASTTEEIEAVKFVLRKFFILEGAVYVQMRILEELEEYRLKAATNKRIATERETNRKEKDTNRARVVNEPPPNHKPLTTNQEPIKIKPSSPSATVSRFLDFWKTYPASERKVGKSTCEKKWSAKKLDSIAEQILQDIQAKAESKQWREGYAPAPLTYLNQERWNDGASHAGNEFEGAI